MKYVFGRSGTGKTYKCVKDIVDMQKKNSDCGESRSLIYIVPEQFSLSSEKMLLQATGWRGLFDAQVLSFMRLAFFVFAETGGIEKVMLEDIGKSMIVRKILLELKNDLKYYGNACGKDGFVDKVSGIISELFQYGVTTETLSEAIEKTDNSKSLYLKLSDLLTIYNKYVEYIAKDFLTTDEILDVLVERIKDSKTIKGSSIWIDCFKSFTPQEYKVIEQLLLYAESVSVALTVDKPDKKYDGVFENDAFYETKNTVNKFSDILEKNKIYIEDMLFLEKNKRHEKIPEIQFLEKNFLRHGKPSVFANSSENITVTYAENMYSEINYTAREIVRLVRENGYRYSEIGILASDLESTDYGKNLNAVFSLYDIPVFVDGSESVLSHPLSELMRGALLTVYTNWSYENVFRMLKSGLVSITTDEIDRLENYILAHGIKSWRWKTEWKAGLNDAGGEKSERFEINEIRQKVIDLLEPLSLRPNKNKTYKVSFITERLYDFMVKSGTKEKLAEWIAEAQLNGENKALREHSQIWSKIVKLLDKMVDVLGNEEVSLQKYAQILDSGLGATKMAVSPPSVDYVVAGDVHLSRLPELKAVFILGMNDGLLPKKISDSGILSDDDRSEIEKGGLINIAEGSSVKLQEEEFLVYNALTRATEKLYLSCYLGGLDGKPLKPSPFLLKIQAMISNCKLRYLDKEDKNNVDFITNAYATFQTFTAYLRNFAEEGAIPQIYKDVYSYYAENEKYKLKLKNIENQIKDINKDVELSQQSVEKLYPKNVRTSVSKLEKFAMCPFSYFVEYNLRAKERKVYEVENVDVGTVFHEILDNMSNELKKNKIDWNTADSVTITRVADNCIDKTISSAEKDIFRSSGQYEYFAARVKSIAKASIEALTEHMRKGSFKLEFSEISFSDKMAEKSLGTIDIELENGKQLNLEGKIDRVDMLETEDGTYVKIIDYKSGKTEFSIDEVYYGLQLQLMVYLSAFIEKWKTKIGQKETKKILPGAVLYFSLLNPILEYNSEMPIEDIKNALLAQYKMSGIVVKNQEVADSIDNAIEGYSSVIPINYKGKDEERDFGENSSVLSLEQFEILMRHTLDIAKSAGDKMVQGVIGVKPYKYKKKNACTYCSYSSICKMDKTADMHKYNVMSKISKKQAIEMIMEQKIKGS